MTDRISSRQLGYYYQRQQSAGVIIVRSIIQQWITACQGQRSLSLYVTTTSQHYRKRIWHEKCVESL